MIINGTAGVLLKTMLLLANNSDKPQEQTKFDFLQTPLGADSGKCV